MDGFGGCGIRKNQIADAKANQLSDIISNKYSKEIYSRRKYYWYHQNAK